MTGRDLLHETKTNRSHFKYALARVPSRRPDREIAERAGSPLHAAIRRTPYGRVDDATAEPGVRIGHGAGGERRPDSHRHSSRPEPARDRLPVAGRPDRDIG